MQPVYVGTAVFTLLEMAADQWMLFKSSRGIEAAAFLCMMKIYIFCIISGYPIVWICRPSVLLVYDCDVHSF